MNILYFAYCGGPGIGGHYHTLYHVSLVLSKVHKIKIITLGPDISPVLNEHPDFSDHISFNGKLNDLINVDKKLKKTTHNFKPDIFHFFDSASMNLLMYLPVAFRIPIVLNNCGGPNSKRRNWQHADAIVNLSFENYEWFINNRYYKSEKVFFIPNRITKSVLDLNYQIEGPKSRDVFTFMRISRIGSRYRKTFIDTFRMIEELIKHYSVQLIVVGKVQEHDVYESLKNTVKKKNLPVKFIMDERANKGTDFLYLTDAVIGTGRSFMEAMSLGIPVLTPASDSDWPVLVNKDNFEQFFTTNFSERNVASESVISENRNAIIKLITDVNEQKKLSIQMLELFEENLGEKGIIEKYNEVYNTLKFEFLERIKLLFKNFHYFIRYIIIKQLKLF